MQITFTKSQLSEYFPELEQKAINSAWLALNIINNLESDRFDIWAQKHLPYYMCNYSTKRIEGLMYYLDKVLECHGVEAINSRDAEYSPYWHDTVALYLNSGDTYNATIIASLEESEFILSTFGDYCDDLQTNKSMEIK